LFLLHPDQRRLVLLIGEPEIEAAVDQQRGTDQPDDQQRVFAEQPAARRRDRFGRGLAGRDPSGRRCILDTRQPTTPPKTTLTCRIVTPIAAPVCRLIPSPRRRGP